MSHNRVFKNKLKIIFYVHIFVKLQNEFDPLNCWQDTKNNCCFKFSWKYFIVLQENNFLFFNFLENISMYSQENNLLYSLHPLVQHSVVVRLLFKPASKFRAYLAKIRSPPTLCGYTVSAWIRGSKIHIVTNIVCESLARFRCYSKDQGYR